MVRVPSPAESKSDFTIPDEDEYVVELIGFGDITVSEVYGNRQQVFKWEILDEDSAFKGTVLWDFVNIDSQYNGLGKSPNPSKLFNICKALLRDEYSSDYGIEDTDVLLGLKCRVELTHKPKKSGGVKADLRYMPLRTRRGATDGPRRATAVDELVGLDPTF